MLKAVLIDDEVLSLDMLEYALDKNEDVEIIGKYTDPLEALENIKRTKPDLVFMDIEMPELDGFSTAKEIMNMGFDTSIVFATVFEQYALKAFEIDAADYVVKPFSEHRLKSTVDRIMKRFQSGQINENLLNDFLKHNLSKHGINKIAVWRENSIVLLDPETILYFTIDEKKVIVHIKNDSYESNSSLCELEEKLADKGFFRCHKSFLINTNYIDKIVPWFNSTFMIKLIQSNAQIPVSRLYTKKLKGMLRI
jgi:two-component system LytT family response regulator/two-component system response regulator LytT